MVTVRAKKKPTTKKTKLPKEIKETVKDTLSKVVKEEPKEEPKEEIKLEEFTWDVPLSQEIKFFDRDLSYELTKYKPINLEKGLDFNPEWFLEARKTYQRTGHYCEYLYGSRAFAKFWDELFDKCRNGCTVNGYTITGDHYFFLNFYLLPNLTTSKAGVGRTVDFPDFYVAQYEWFHYLELCKQLRKNAALMKARGLGFSEMNASLAANMYTVRDNSNTIIVANLEKYVKDTLSKVWSALSFLNDHTDDGFSLLAQVINNSLQRRASYIENRNGLKVESGSKAIITGIVADSPNKIRGDRTDLLLYEEGGCHARGTLVMLYNGTFKSVEDVKLGDLLMGDDGTPRKVLQLHQGKLMMYEIKLTNGDVQVVNSEHIIYGKRYLYNKKEYIDFLIKAEDYYNMVKDSPRKADGYKLVKSNKIKFEHRDVPLDPYLFGLWLGDGNSNSPRFTNEDPEILKYLRDYAKLHNLTYTETPCDNTKQCKHVYLGRSSMLENPITLALRGLNVLNNKHIPDCYIYNSADVLLQVLAGLIDSDGNYQKTKHVVEITQSEERKHIIDQAATICRILGMRISLGERISVKRTINNKTVQGGTKLYRLKILYGHSQIPTKILRKNTTEREEKYRSSHDRNANSFRITPLKVDDYFGFSLDGNLLFLLKDFTICHNSWINSTKAFIQGDALIHILGNLFGYKVIGGKIFPVDL